MSDATRPRLLLFPDPDEWPDPYFRVTSLDPIAGWLALHFEVVEAIPGEDVVAAVDRLQPEMGLLIANGRRLAYDRERVSRFREAFGRGGPPLGVYSVMDASAPGKIGFFSSIASLEVDVVFSPDTGLVELAGDFADRIICVPWFVDGGLFQDYGLEKTYPIACLGAGFERVAGTGHYPWRAGVASALRPHFPVFSSPRPNRRRPHDLIGEAYARALNRTRLAFSCGSVRSILVKKHFEIPAAGACLVTQDTPVVREIGFEDGVNCRFASPEDVVDVCNELLGDPERVEAMTRRGFEFVHARHTAAARDTLIQWLRCWKERRAGQSIVQTSLSAPLTVETNPGEAAAPSTTRADAGPMLRAMRSGMNALCLERDARVAFDRFEEMTRLSRSSPESRVCRGMAFLALGYPGYALRCFDEALWQGILRTLHRPDPVIWALYLITLAAGDANPALRSRCAVAFHSLSHPLLDWARAELGCPEATGTTSDPPGKDGWLSESFLAFPQEWGQDAWESFGEYLLGAGRAVPKVEINLESDSEDTG